MQRLTVVRAPAQKSCKSHQRISVLTVQMAVGLQLLVVLARFQRYQNRLGCYSALLNRELPVIDSCPDAASRSLIQLVYRAIRGGWSTYSLRWLRTAGDLRILHMQQQSHYTRTTQCWVDSCAAAVRQMAVP